MKVGDLVKNKRARIPGIPIGTMGYISRIDVPPAKKTGLFIYRVTILSDGKERKFLLQDLELVNECR